VVNVCTQSWVVQEGLRRRSLPLEFGYIRSILDTSRSRCHFFGVTAFDITKLSPQERLDLIGRRRDSLDSEDVRLTPAQQSELDRRLATLDEGIKAGSTWEQIEAEFDRRYP
jgi:putative addiction module component (TIGR02574 family)